MTKKKKAKQVLPNYFVQDCSDVTTFTESAVYILHIFANNFGTKRDSLLQ